MPSSDRNEHERSWLDDQWVGNPWRLRTLEGRPRRTGISRWIPVVVAVILQTPGLLIAARHWTDWRTLVAFALAWASSLLLAVVRKYPGPVTMTIAVLCAPAIAIGVGPPLSAIPLAISIVIAVSHGQRLWVWVTLAGVAVVVPLVTFLITGSTLATIRPLIIAIVFCFLVAVGEMFRNRRERYRQLSRDIAARRQSAAEAERVRMARELHDVLAHSLSQISVQAGVGLHLFDTQPERARESLAAIRTTSGRALEEVRGVLGFLRSDGETAARAPEPKLDQLPALVDSYVGSGMSVVLDNRLHTELPVPAQLAIYRIVQESLTNAVRHSGANSVVIDLRDDNSGPTAELEGNDDAVTRNEGARDVVLTVRDDGHGAPATSSPGRGLIGMRERAELLGGTITMVSPDGGGFEVELRIPRASTPGFSEGPR